MPEAMLSEIASRSERSRISEITPNDANTVPWPITSGIAAAMGDRKTSSRTMIRIGAASSSALWAPSVVASLMSLPSGASPARWDSSGGETRSSTNRSRGGTIVLWVPPGGTSRSSVISALSGLGRS